MKLELTKSARVTLAAGSIVEVDPVQARALLGMKQAKAVEEQTEEPKKTVKKSTKK